MRIRELGVTVLLVEQRLVEALAIADRAYVLQTGRIVMSGPAAEIAGGCGGAAGVSGDMIGCRGGKGVVMRFLGVDELARFCGE